MSYDIIDYNARRWVTRSGRLLGGYSSNELRAYVFPLYTPNGVLVLQEAPADHPHHQGVFAGAELDGNDLWNAGSFGLPRHRQELLGKLTDIRASASESRVAFSHDVRWTTADGNELLAERRTVVLRDAGECTVAEWRSTFSHLHKATRFGQIKESGLGVRVPPHWETRFGGRIRDGHDRRGEAGCFDQSSPWLSIEGAAGSEARAGVVLVPTSEPCPWFTRDYGVHIYNPARHRTIDLEPGAEVTWSFRVLAYDGARTIRDIDRLVAAIEAEGAE
jgi:Methane oxygenase PmoA